MQEIFLYVRQTDESLRIDSPPSISTTLHPLLRMFFLPRSSPFKEVVFLPEEINYWKGSINANGNGKTSVSTVPLALVQ
ncbi:hypothetical protein MLD38_003716 [Melastoma candidum]|uniref:Uncharacterized protein n=1 Tax=Melastoma candidum TaxID=119954 RepID=A0ACB9S5F7_9MYRT|nr:hypothetical protein MLD38_003716 [Melastoma candidum]